MNHKAKLLDWDAVAAAMKGLQERGETQKMLLVACAAYTGCRPGDFTKFQWSTFIGKDGEVLDHVDILEKKPEHIMAAKGKTAKKRRIVLLPEFKEILKSVYATRLPRDRGYLFYTRFTVDQKTCGITTQTANTWLKSIAAEYGLPADISTYSFRKTCARKIFDSFKEKDFAFALRLTQQFLNHSSPTTTMHYIGLADEELSLAFSKLTLL